MGKLTILSNTSWVQSFGIKPKKQFASWTVPKKIRQFCKLKDGIKRKINIRFEGKYKLEETKYFSISSGGELLFPKELGDRIENIVTRDPRSYFIATILDVDSTNEISTYLFAWNPKKWNWKTLEQTIEQIEQTGHASEKWSVISHKKIKPGDRAFLMRLGEEPKGIMASGFVTTPPFLSKHWSGEEKLVHRVVIDFEVVLNPAVEPLLNLDMLNQGNLAKVNWTPQSSGIEISNEIAKELEEVWFNFLNTQNVINNPFKEIHEKKENVYSEGTPNQVLVTRYERNPYARKVCIENYGVSCSVCEFNFEMEYGELGKDFIHVHHLKQVADIGKEYKIDPKKDLRPVCPNCHAMIHKQKVPLSIDELKNKLKKHRLK